MLPPLSDHVHLLVPCFEVSFCAHLTIAVFFFFFFSSFFSLVPSTFYLLCSTLSFLCLPYFLLLTTPPFHFLFRLPSFSLSHSLRSLPSMIISVRTISCPFSWPLRDLHFGKEVRKREGLVEQSVIDPAHWTATT